MQEISEALIGYLVVQPFQLHVCGPGYKGMHEPDVLQCADQERE